MNILYITARDYMGQQFNGYLLKKELEKQGHNVSMFVGESRIHENNIYQVSERFSNNWLEKKLHTALMHIDESLIRLEEFLSLYSLLPLASFEMYRKEWYRHADIIHLQLPHSISFFSLLNLPILGQKKN